MAKKYSVRPVLRPGTHTFVATFRQAAGRRVTRSLGTDGRVLAGAICGELVRLWVAGVRKSGDIGAEMRIGPDATALYFDEPVRADEVHADASAIVAQGERVRRELAAFPAAQRDLVFPLIVKWIGAAEQLDAERGETARWKNAYSQEREARMALERSAIGQAVQATARVPAVATCLEQFRAHIFSDTSALNARYVYSLALKFVEGLRPECATMADLRADDIAGWVDGQVEQGAGDKRASRRDALRRRIGRFVNFVAHKYDYPSQMLRVAAVKRGEIRRERGDIHWHELADVEAAIARQEGAYWPAVIAMLAYAGLQLAELVWLRPGDVRLVSGFRGSRVPGSKGPGQIWVTTVADPDDPKQVHLLKTEHRRRAVSVHPRLLLPRLKAFVEAGLAGRDYFFAMPAEMERRRRKSFNHAERWVPHTLVMTLLGQAARLDKSGREIYAARPGILPVGMTAKSLRRTFGSLLLRSGKTTADVAAAMGNTEDVVREHYARMLGCEVDVEF